jgi:phosphoglycolate phosphatase-like HAD superfamily hydrolase
MEYEHPGTDLGVLDEVLRTRCGRSASARDAAQYIECYLALLSAERDRNRLEEVTGAGAVLSCLSTHDVWRCAIATGGWQRSAKFKMAAAGLSIGSIPAAFAEDGPAREAVVLRAIERAGTLCGVDTFERVVLLGDALWDLRTAQRLRLPFVGVGRGPARERLLQAGCGHVLNDFLEITSVVHVLEHAGLPSPQSLEASLHDAPHS